MRRFSEFLTRGLVGTSPDVGTVCRCCGSCQFRHSKVLWRKLIDDWQLSPYEIDYTNRQQGTCCRECGANLRTSALAQAIMNCFGFPGLFSDFISRAESHMLSVLEINRAGQLTQYLEKLPHHIIVEYPQADMQQLDFEDGRFDLIVHSDTLEHIPEPVRGLSECARVLRPGGFCTFTVPIIVDRLTRTREGLPPSYHGSSENPEDCRVVTEYGADVWKDVFLAGFRECRIVALFYPAAQALVGVK